jgi:hypothetical protein
MRGLACGGIVTLSGLATGSEAGETGFMKPPATRIIVIAFPTMGEDNCQSSHFRAQAVLRPI